MSSAGDRGTPPVLVTVGYYLPGFKAGGVVRTVVNMVDHMGATTTFRVVTGDRDLGDLQPYPGVTRDAWHPVGPALVWYASPESRRLGPLAAVEAPYADAPAFLNSFFDPLTVKTLVNRRLGHTRFQRVIVSPRGEFGWASLRQKYAKKRAFIEAARAAGLFRGVVWHASSAHEAADMARALRVPERAIVVVQDFPLHSDAGSSIRPHEVTMPSADLHLVYLSRLAKEKNLLFALEALAGVRRQVVYDIYGPKVDDAYWALCEAAIARLPSNITVRYQGVAAPDAVVSVFAAYDGFLFPSGGEAFGHVIAESLLAGTPVLISQDTAFRDLTADGLGWDLSLSDRAAFTARIEAWATEWPSQDAAARALHRASVRRAAARRLHDPAIADGHRRMFWGDLG